jgi:hypothetical protein
MFTVQDDDVYQFVDNPLILRTIKEEVGVQVSIAKARGQDLTPTQHRKVAFHTYTRLTYGFLIRGLRLVSSPGSHIGYHETAAAVGKNIDIIRE